MKTFGRRRGKRGAGADRRASACFYTAFALRSAEPLVSGIIYIQNCLFNTYQFRNKKKVFDGHFEMQTRNCLASAFSSRIRLSLAFK